MRYASAAAWRCGEDRQTGTRGIPRQTPPAVPVGISSGTRLGTARAGRRTALSRKSFAETRVRSCVIDDRAEVPQLVPEHVPAVLGEHVIAALRRLAVDRFPDGAPLFDQPAFFEPLYRLVQRPGAETDRAAGSRLDFLFDGIAVPGSLSKSEQNMKDGARQWLPGIFRFLRHNVSLDDTFGKKFI